MAAHTVPPLAPPPRRQARVLPALSVLSTGLRRLQALGWRPLAVATGGMADIAVPTFAFLWTADWSGWL